MPSSAADCPKRRADGRLHRLRSASLIARALAAPCAVVLLLAFAAAAQPRPPPAACVADGTITETSSLQSFADPFVFCADGRLYAMATNWHDLQTPSRDIHIPIARLEPNLGWRLERQADGTQLDALPSPPPWSHAPDPSDRRDLWAPEVIKVGARYVMYFSARHASALTPAGRHRPCIGAATSDYPDHAFKASPTPLLCTEFQEGMIDPSPFREGGKLLLYYKVDGNCCGLRAGIYASRLTSDGLAVIGSPQALGVVNDRDWEGDVVEAPTMMRHGARHMLFYSGNVFSHRGYGVGSAVCATAVGPCIKTPAPLLQSHDALLGPGHQSVFSVGGHDYIAFHALAPNTPLNDNAERYLHIERLDWCGGTPAVVPLPVR